MKTEILTDNIARAAEIIAAGGLVAVPTETVYGLAVNGLSAAAVDKLFAVKGRPAEKAVSLLVSGSEDLEKYGENIPRTARVLADRFWPGPLTIVVQAKEGVTPDNLRAGGGTIGLRCPACEPTQDLLKTCGVPLAAPSANPSGAASPRTAQETAQYFDGSIDAILDGGPCAIGQESTVVDLSSGTLSVLRQGALAQEDIRKAMIGSLCIVGITGGTGAGKTTALEDLQARGALVIDADAVYHGLCDTCGEMLERIEARFPGAVKGGVLQRKQLGSVVFADEAALAALRAITDPYVDREINRLLYEYAVADGKYAAVDAINLLDTNLKNLVSVVVGILAPPEERIRRLQAREGISAEYARLRIDAQPSNAWFEEHCDAVIYNDGSREQFCARCDQLFLKLMED